MDPAFDGVIRVRRYLCRICKRTVSLLPEFALPWQRFSISVIALFLVARLFKCLTLAAAALAAGQTSMPYQRGSSGFAGFKSRRRHWAYRWRRSRPHQPQPILCRALLSMLESIGWIAAHRFLFSQLRAHLLGWPQFLVPDGRRTTLTSAVPSA